MVLAAQVACTGFWVVLRTCHPSLFIFSPTWTVDQLSTSVFTTPLSCSVEWYGENWRVICMQNVYRGSSRVGLMSIKDDLSQGSTDGFLGRYWLLVIKDNNNYIWYLGPIYIYHSFDDCSFKKKGKKSILIQINMLTITIISGCVQESVSKIIWACIVLFADCVVPPRPFLIFTLTVDAIPGAASFLRFSQTPKMHVWLDYSTHAPHFYQSSSAAGKT